jgi:peptidyl-prolyl cis-trans isomerase C
MADTMITPSGFACVNGVALQGADGPLNAEELRQRACSELLRQAAIAESLLDGTDAPPDDGVLSEAASEAIEALLKKCVVVPEPSEEACRRHHAAHRSFYSSGERVRARHILFAVTQGRGCERPAPARRGHFAGRALS